MCWWFVGLWVYWFLDIFVCFVFAICEFMVLGLFAGLWVCGFAFGVFECL